jgi:outer membrane receptor protein involved in Fe transport
MIDKGVVGARLLLAGVSLLALCAPHDAQAQSDDVTSMSEIIVTGSRVIRDGTRSPTPVTVLTGEALEEKAPSNIPDALNQLPQFRGSFSQTQGNTFSPASPNQGNYLNLRNLGTQRVLILLDGVRVPPTRAAAGVDINTLPQMLVQRVDVVTGGASAAYGSDAVTGVVNFILDKAFTGVRATAQAGTSIYGDADSYKFGVAAGTSLFGGRGHFIGSYENYRSDGLNNDDRDPWDQLYVFTGLGTAASPFRVTSNARYRNLTFGGLITDGPASLVGQRFEPNGSIVPMDRGQATASSTVSVGGDGAWFGTRGGPQPTLVGELKTQQVFGRFSYQLAPTLEAFAQVSYGESRNLFTSTSDNRQPGGPNALTIFSGNAFLAPDVQARLTASGAASFGMARQNGEIPNFLQNHFSNALTATIGLTGDLGGTWKWNASYVYGNSRLRAAGRETYNPRFYAAVDAVRNSNGAIVCRVTLTNPGLYPGCVPFNPFGEGAPSPEAVDYVLGVTRYQVANEMQIVAANVQGDVIDLWAGPLSIAFGVEARRQTLEQTTNADPATPFDRTGLRGIPATSTRYRSTNVGIAEGAVNVKEAYIEAALPLARNLPLLQSLEANAAYRATDYSTSGLVNTWKFGLSYQPFEDLRFRSTLSRDIAAPSLYQLVQGTQLSQRNLLDPHTGVTAQTIEVISGSPTLSPEIGAMTVMGAVYTPSWAPGFSISLDRYAVHITDAINITSSAQQVLDCEASGGTAPVCNLIIRPLPYSNKTPANFPTQVLLQPQNLSKLYQVGYDIEASYRTPLDTFVKGWSGNIDFRVLVSVLDTYKIKQGPLTATLEYAGAGDRRVSGDPGGENAKLRGSFEIGYQNGPLSLRVTERATGKSKLSFLEVYEGDDGVQPNVFYTDLAASYALGAKRRSEVFFNARNLFNKAPPIVPSTPATVGIYPTNRVVYDVIGAYFTVGVRLRW